MSIEQDLIDGAKQAAVTQAKVSIARSKDNFIALYGNFFKPDDLVRVEDYWSKALAAKTAQFMAMTEDEAQVQADIYDAYLDAIEEIGTDYLIVGTAKAGVFARGLLHEVIGGGFAIAGAVLQVGLNILFPGVGGLVGAGLNAGIQHVVAHFNK